MTGAAVGCRGCGSNCGVARCEVCDGNLLCTRCQSAGKGSSLPPIHSCGEPLTITDEYFSAAVFRKWDPEQACYVEDGRNDYEDEKSYICGHCGECLSRDETDWYLDHQIPKAESE